jgi:HEAT repeat protein
MMSASRAPAFLPVFVALAFLIEPVRADEQHTFYGKTVDGWIAVLRDKTSTDQKRLQAVWALGCLDSGAKAAVPDLIMSLQQASLENEAVEALVRIGSNPELTIPRLIQRFRKQGCLYLTGAGAIGWDPYLGDTLVRVGEPAVPALIAVLNGPNWDMRVCAAESLGSIGPRARAAVPALIRAIEQPDPADRVEVLIRHAARALGRIGPDAEAAVPALNRLLDRNVIDEFDIVIALAGIGSPPVRRLTDSIMRNGDSYAASQLAWLGQRSGEAAPALRAALADKRPQVRFSAAVAVAFIEPTCAETVPVLIEALNYLNDEEIDVSATPRALAHLGPKANAALPALIGLAQKVHDRGDILRALVQIDPGGKVCVPALIEVLKSDDCDYVAVAANCLGLLGPRAKEAAPALAQVLTREFEENERSMISDPKVSAAKALKRIGASAVSTVPELIVALREAGDFSAAAAAANVLGSFGPKAKAAVPYLIETVKAQEKDTEDWRVREAAILALGRIGPDAKVAIPVLRNAMKDFGKRLQASTEVLIALYQLEPDGKTLAEGWLGNFGAPAYQVLDFRLIARAMLLGAMGRTSLESDWLTSRVLERMDSMAGSIDPREEESIEQIEHWLETLGSFGSAGRRAIPHLNELCKHPNPWVRMWAAETLEKLTAPARPAGTAQQN